MSCWVTNLSRISELKRCINDYNAELLQISKDTNTLSTFANASGDGIFTTDELTSLSGTNAYEDAMCAATGGAQYATDFADTKVQEYEDLYNTDSSSVPSTYINSDGTLNTEAIGLEFYDQGLKEYVSLYVTPTLQAKETELTSEKTNYESLLTAMNAELESLESTNESAIQKSAVKLVA